MLTIQASRAAIRSVAFAVDGRSLVVDQLVEDRESEGLRELVWWDIGSRTPTRRFPLLRTIWSAGSAAHEPEAYPHGPPSDVTFSPVANKVAAPWSWGGVEDPICVFDLAADVHECTWFPMRNYVFRAAFSPDGTRLALATEQQQCDVYQLLMWPAGAAPGGGPGRFTREGAWESARWQTLPDELEPRELGETPEIAFDGRFVACIWPPLRGVFLWDTQCGEDADPNRLRRLSLSFTAARLALVPRGGPLLFVGGERLGLCSPGRPEIRDLDPPSDATTALGLDTAGESLAVGGRNGTLEVRRSPDWRAGVRLVSRQSPITAVAFSPGGKTCATGDDDGWVTVWDVPD